MRPQLAGLASPYVQTQWGRREGRTLVTLILPTQWCRTVWTLVVYPACHLLSQQYRTLRGRSSWLRHDWRGEQRWGERKEDFGVGGGTEGSLCVWKTVGQKMQLHSVYIYQRMGAFWPTRSQKQGWKREKSLEKRDFVVLTVVHIRFPNISSSTNSPGLIRAWSPSLQRTSCPHGGMLQENTFGGQGWARVGNDPQWGEQLKNIKPRQVLVEEQVQSPSWKDPSCQTHKGLTGIQDLIGEAINMCCEQPRGSRLTFKMILHHICALWNMFDWNISFS